MTLSPTSADPLRLTQNAQMLVLYASGLAGAILGALFATWGAIIVGMPQSADRTIGYGVLVISVGTLTLPAMVHRWRRWHGRPDAPAAMTPFVGAGWTSRPLRRGEIWLCVAMGVLLLVYPIVMMLMAGIDGWRANYGVALVAAVFAVLVFRRFLTIRLPESLVLAAGMTALALGACYANPLPIGELAGWGFLGMGVLMVIHGGCLHMRWRRWCRTCMDTVP